MYSAAAAAEKGRVTTTTTWNNAPKVCELLLISGEGEEEDCCLPLLHVNSPVIVQFVLCGLVTDFTQRDDFVAFFFVKSS